MAPLPHRPSPPRSFEEPAGGRSRGRKEKLRSRTTDAPPFLPARPCPPRDGGQRRPGGGRRRRCVPWVPWRRHVAARVCRVGATRLRGRRSAARRSRVSPGSLSGGGLTQLDSLRRRRQYRRPSASFRTPYTMYDQKRLIPSSSGVTYELVHPLRLRGHRSSKTSATSVRTRPRPASRKINSFIS